MSKKAIFLSGGGARGAYQVGVLKAISDITQSENLPADILSSISAGAINASFLAMHANDFKFSVSKLVELWSSLTCDKVFRTSNFSLITSVVRNLSNMVLHSKIKGGAYLLDTAPLKTLLDTHLDFKKINANIEKGLLSSFEVAATCYDLSQNTSFFKSTTPIQYWGKTRHSACANEISCKHILASTAIPFFFPAVKIDSWHYGDGGTHLAAPLRASIKLGADRILVIGTREKASLEATASTSSSDGISFAKVLGSILHALFSDNLVRDVELLTKINCSMHLISQEKQKELAWKPIDMLYIYPSVDLAELTQGKETSLPFLLRYLMGAFGSKEQSGDLLSFLLFESDYCKTLIDIGYQDAIAQKDAIKDFFT